jgi:hypothetical protein
VTASQPSPIVGTLRLTLGAVDGLIDSLSQTPDRVVRGALLLSIDMQAILLQEEAVRLYLMINRPDDAAETEETEAAEEIKGGVLE